MRRWCWNNNYKGACVSWCAAVWRMWGAAFLCNDKCAHILNRMKQSVYSTTKASSQLMRLACPICKSWSTSFSRWVLMHLDKWSFPCSFVTRELQSCPVAAYGSYTTNLSVLWIAEDRTGEEQDPKNRDRSSVEHLVNVNVVEHG